MPQSTAPERSQIVAMLLATLKEIFLLPTMTRLLIANHNTFLIHPSVPQTAIRATQRWKLVDWLPAPFYIMGM